MRSGSTFRCGYIDGKKENQIRVVLKSSKYQLAIVELSQMNSHGDILYVLNQKETVSLCKRIQK